MTRKFESYSEDIPISLFANSKPCTQQNAHQLCLIKKLILVTGGIGSFSKECVKSLPDNYQS